MGLDSEEMDYNIDADVGFLLFQLLPIEIRRMIWKYAIPPRELSFWRPYPSLWHLYSCVVRQDC
jgi:hypothetical protein